MFVSKVGKAPNIYVKLFESYRNENGVPRNRPILNFGRYDDLIKDDPQAFEKLRAKYREESQGKKDVTAEFRRKQAEEQIAVASSSGLPLPVLSYAPYILKKIWEDDLGLNRKIAYEQSRTRIVADQNAIIGYLAALKVIDPHSVLSSYGEKDNFLGDPVKEASLADFYNALSYAWKIKNGLMKWVNQRLDTQFGKDRATMVFYDVTNAYFETPLTDEEKGYDTADFIERANELAAVWRTLPFEAGGLMDYCFDENGEIIPDTLTLEFLDALEDEKIEFLRMRGPSKEHRTDLPIVSIALVVDGNGMPMDFEVFAGNDSEYDTMIKSIESLKAKYGISGATVTADRGINSVKNLKMLKEAGLGFLVAQKITQFPKELTEKMLDESQYRPLDPAHPEKGRYLEIENWVKKGRNKAEGDVTCTLVLTYSEKRRKRDEAILNAWIQMIERKKANGEKIKARKSGWASIAKTDGKPESFITGIDKKALARRRSLCGYAGLVYSSPEGCHKKLSGNDLSSAYHKQVRIEDCFRIMKSNLGLRPMFVWNSNQIKGHITICMLALLMVRLLQNRLERQGSKMSIREIVSTLNEARVAVTGTGEKALFLPIGKRRNLRKGRENLSTSEICEAIRNGGIRISRLPELMAAVGLEMPAGLCKRQELARCLGTSFPSANDAMPEVCTATLDL